jgi:hypothetical protein
MQSKGRFGFAFERMEKSFKMLFEISLDLLDFPSFP